MYKIRISQLLFILTITFSGTTQVTTNSTVNVNFNTCYLHSKIIYHSYYSLLYSEDAEQAKWVAYKLTPSFFQNYIERTNDFREDSLILTGSSSLDDYHKSGYDRGHLAPAGSMKLNERSMSESFFMSNISPQKPSFNRGIWKRLEGKVRYWAESNDSIFVITGPILDHPIDTIGPNEVIVPRAFFKTLIAYKDGKARGIAFLVPHEKSDKSLYSFATSIDVIEELTGLDFYCKLDIELQSILESNSSIKDFMFPK